MHISWGGKEQGARAVSAARLLPQPISHPQPPARGCPHVPPAAAPRAAHQKPSHPCLVGAAGMQQEGQEVKMRAQETQKDTQEIWHPLSTGCEAVWSLSKPILGTVGHRGLLRCRESPVPALSCRHLGNHRTVPRLS